MRVGVLGSGINRGYLCSDLYVCFVIFKLKCLKGRKIVCFVVFVFDIIWYLCGVL